MREERMVWMRVRRLQKMEKRSMMAWAWEVRRRLEGTMGRRQRSRRERPVVEVLLLLATRSKGLAGLL